MLKGAILLVFDKAVDEPGYSSMYAQLCLKLSKFAPNFEDPGSKANTFWKLLLHKCQEEFENRKQATEVFEGRDGLSVEEEEQRALAKRKMLGNIKFVGELFKLGMVHEAIIHNCIKELLERKRGQSIDDMCQNVECLCHCMTTVGQILDTDKAKAWINKYFSRITSLSSNQELPSRIRFMLLNVIDLRKRRWAPRDVASFQSQPRPIHVIRQEALQTQLQHSSPFPPPPLSIHHTPLHKGVYDGPPSGATGDEGFVTSPLKDSPLSPQDAHIPHSFPPPSLPRGSAPLNAPQSLAESKFSAEKKPRKLPSGKKDNTVSLRPAMSSLKLGSGSSRRTPSPSNNPSSFAAPATAAVAKEAGMAHMVPRTRDDSSDEEEEARRKAHRVPPSMAHPQLHHNSPFTPHPPHFTLPYPPTSQQPLGPGIILVPRGHRGWDQQPVMFPLPSGQRLPHPPSHPLAPPPHAGRLPPHPMSPPSRAGGLPPHPHQYFGPDRQPHYPPYVFGPRPTGPPLWPGPHSHPHSGPPSDRPHPIPHHHTSTPDHKRQSKEMREGIPPHLDRKGSIPVHYASKSVGGKRSGSKSRTPHEDSDRAIESIIREFLKSLNVETAVARIRAQEKMNYVALCSQLMSKSLEMSEDARTHISGLLSELHSQQLLSNSGFVKAFNSVVASGSDYEKTLPQWQTYLAGFAARAIAKGMVTLKELAPTFLQGAHYPTILIILQALLPLIGEEELYKRFTESNLSLTTLLPPHLRSHNSITEITEYKKLGFLYPLKRVQSELTAMLREGASPGSLYKWIESNVDVSFFSTPELVMVLTRIILSHVTGETSLGRDVPRSAIPSVEVIGKEKELMEKFKILVQKFVTDSISLQVCVTYATQVFCHDSKFPKGLTLRLFSYWYEMDVIEGEALLKWKEDMSHEYPGKGQTLFQVNHWLTLVEEAENDESSSDEN